MIKCIKFRPYAKNTLRGFVDLELVQTGLILRDCCWHQKGDREWIAFPARSYEKSDGSTSWSPLIEFAQSGSKSREAFQRQALAAVHAMAAKETAV